MKIITAMATQNDCYKAAKKMPRGPEGIVVHSTGVNNPYLKRYVDAPKEVGKNQYGNHWNQPSSKLGREVCVHAFIGYALNKEVAVAQILPYDICCWGVGKGSKGSYNYDPAYIQFEMCEDALTNEAYFNAVMKTAQEYCAMLVKQFNIPIKNIVGHYEAHKLGYGSNHGDPLNWFSRFGKDMDWFRNEVKKLVNTAAPTPAQPTQPAAPTTPGKKPEVGDIVQFEGGYHYRSSNATSPTGQKQAPGPAKVTEYYPKGKHPYHVVHTNSRSNVYGWVDEETIIAEDTFYKFKKGDKVKIKAGASYWSGQTVPTWVQRDTWIVYEDQPVTSDRVVINKNVSGKNAIMSPISAEFLTLVK